VGLRASLGCVESIQISWPFQELKFNFSAIQLVACHYAMLSIIYKIICNYRQCVIYYFQLKVVLSKVNEQCYRNTKHKSTVLMVI
jgi:hypothetical protein